jgi:hypothetical protein
MPRKKRGQRIATAPSQTYGDAAAQEEAQRAMPLPRTTDLVPRPTARPGGFGMLNRPTEKPREPLTAGAPVGPGPGPAVLPGPASGLTTPPLSPRVRAMLPLLEHAAAMPGASRATTRLVRQLRVRAQNTPLQVPE